MRTGLNEYKDVGNVKIGGLHHSPFEGEGQRAIGEAHGLRLESILPKPRTNLVRVGIMVVSGPGFTCGWVLRRPSLLPPSYLKKGKRRHGRFFREIPGRIDYEFVRDCLERREKRG